MKHQRLQPFCHPAHKLSAALRQVARCIQTTDYTQAIEWQRLTATVTQTCTLFERYARKENNILFPLLHQYEPALAAILRDQQAYRQQYLQALHHLFAAAGNMPEHKKAKLFSHQLIYRLHEFIALVSQQLHEAEAMINRVLWKYYTNAELIPIRRAFCLPAMENMDAADKNGIERQRGDNGGRRVASHFRRSPAYRKREAMNVVALAV